MADVTMSDRDVQDLGAYRYLGQTPGELAKKIADLEKDNQKGREKAKELEAAAAKAPAEGAVVLTGEDATEYAAWKALGVKAADVAKLQGENATLTADKATRERKDAFAKVAKLHGMPEDAAATMAGLVLFQGATFEFKPAKGKDKNGNDADTEEVLVTLAGDGQTQQKFADLLGTAPELKGVRMEAGTQAETGITVPEQRGQSGQPTAVAGGVDEMIEANRRAASAGNPLKPAKAA